MLRGKVLLVFLLFTKLSYAEVKLPNILSTNMVIKQQSKVKLWGYTSISKTLTITTSWDQKKYIVKSGKHGFFETLIKTPRAGGPYQIIFDDGDKKILDDILIGEVWLCSGQSNMEMPLKGYSSKQFITNSTELIANAENYNLRLFQANKSHSDTLKLDNNGLWQLSTPKSVTNFSALAYQFGQLLQLKLKVPVGIIDASVGGTTIRNWMGNSYSQFAEMYPNANLDPENRRPNVFFNGMIYPLRNFAVSGFIWYQGEADRAKHLLYQKMMKAMVNEWRQLWDLRKLGFYYVQIAPWTYPDDKGVLKSPYMREAQQKIQQTLSNTEMVVTADIGSDQSIHPPNKTEIAKRLLNIALAKTYKLNVPYQSLNISSFKKQKNSLLLKFKHTYGQLIVNENETDNFEIAGANQIFYPAKVVVHKHKLIVFSEKIIDPIAVRYGFKNYFKGNIFNKIGLPAAPFRTDNW
ncbi:MAG: sialate O-acetylesterase [Flavobacterium sp.]|nr:MAG: sialate O-acetylesterase [Flavobacterium sp.]